MAERDDIELAVRIVPKGANGTVRLSIDFDGAQPPNQFFADLDMIGWQVSAMPPPPREAIDWSRPDPETGQRFSLSSWQVVGFVVEPPNGSARGEAWAPDETRPFMAGLNGVLRRHGLGGERYAPPAEVAPPPPPRSEVSTAAASSGPRDTSRSRASKGLRRHGVDGSETPVPILESIGVPEGLDPVRLVADLSNAELVGRVELALSTIGLTALVATVERTITESYRASTYDRQEHACVLDMTMPRSSVVAVIAILREFGTTPAYDTARFIEFDQASAAGGAAPTPILSAVHPHDQQSEPLAIVSLLIDPPRRILVEDELEELAVQDIVWSKSERVVEETFRGSAYQRTVATLRLQVWVAPDEVRIVAPILAHAAGVLMEDTDRFEVQQPGAPTEGHANDSADPNAPSEADLSTGGLRTA